MKLFYRKYGNGPPLIILHGLYGSSDNWATIANSLSNSFTVYLPDQRNHGQSPHDNRHDYDSMRDDLFELAGDLKLKKFFLAGHSMGGKTAISFALKWPEMINGLLIADISPFINENTNRSAYNQHLAILKAMLSIDLSLISNRREAELILVETIPSEKVRGFILKNLQRTSTNKFSWKINVPCLLKNLDKIMEGIDRGSAFSQQITGFPVIFLKGKDSDYIPFEDFRDHWIHSDRPDEVIKNLKKLLSDS
jgi:esterase